MKPDILPLSSVRNPRDLGGYIGFDGRRIKKHRLIRSGKVSNISAKDKQFLLNYGLTKTIDLRSSMECKYMPDQKIKGVEYYNLPLSETDNTKGGKGNLQKVFDKYRQDQYLGFRLMCDRYRNHVGKKEAQESLYKIIKILLATPKGAVLYHCSEGKDRTGIVTMLILYLLGVDLETIRQDYLYSNYMLTTYRAVRDQKFKDNGENLKFRANMRILGSVSDAFFDTALITIKARFGGLDNYVKNQLHVTDQMKSALRALYLEEK